MPVEIDPGTVTRQIWLMTALSFLLATVSGIGEWLGWWAPSGESGMTVGGVAGVGPTVVGILSTSSHGRGQRVHDTVGETGHTLRSMDEYLGSMDGGLSSLDQKLEKLDFVEQPLSEEDGETSKPDVVQIEIEPPDGRAGPAARRAGRDPGRDLTLLRVLRSLSP